LRAFAQQGSIVAFCGTRADGGRAMIDEITAAAGGLAAAVGVSGEGNGGGGAFGAAFAVNLIGAEGGLDPQEMAAAAAAGFVAVRLGPRVLRTETAGLAALAAMQVLWGDFKGDDNV